MTNPRRNYENIAFVASNVAQARSAKQRLGNLYGNAAPEDGARSSSRSAATASCCRPCTASCGIPMPIYGMNRGSVGFLMNEYREDRVAGTARPRQDQHDPSAADAAPSTAPARPQGALAFNEVSLFRLTHQAARLRITVDGLVRLEELICDGVLVATPAGCTAYNLSASRSDPADQRRVAGADADQPVPPPALARRAAAQHGEGPVRRAGVGKASGERRCRPQRVPLCH